MKTIELFKNQKVNGFGNEVSFSGGRLHLVASGIFDKSKIKYQVSYDDGKSYNDYLSGGDKIFTQSVAGKGFYIIEDMPIKIRASLSNEGPDTNISIMGYYNQYYSPKHNLIGVS